jgi:hypothetical protein
MIQACFPFMFVAWTISAALLEATRAPVMLRLEEREFPLFPLAFACLVPYTYARRSSLCAKHFNFCVLTPTIPSFNHFSFVAQFSFDHHRVSV